jgi:hypothetical protein
MKYKLLENSPEWSRWVEDNVQRGANPTEIFSILVRNEFLVSSIKRAMGNIYPQELGQALEELEPKTIFVSLAALNEPYLEFTLDSLFKNATHPDFIRVALVDQSDQDNRPWLSEKQYWKNIRYIAINPLDSLGVSWARHLAFTLYTNEDYFLQIDAHSLFDSGWDVTLSKAIAPLQLATPKPVISTYPPPFEFNKNGLAYWTIDREKMAGHVLQVTRNPEHHVTKDSLNWQFLGTYVTGTKPILGYAISAGFIFTLGRFIEEVPYDPLMYFSAEEKNLGVRAFTNGWDVYHVPLEQIPLAHLYRKPDDGRHKSLHWNSDDDVKRKIKSSELTKISVQRFAQIIQGQVFGPYGLGKERSLQSFCEFSDIPYIQVYGKG